MKNDLPFIGAVLGGVAFGALPRPADRTWGEIRLAGVLQPV